LQDPVVQSLSIFITLYFQVFPMQKSWQLRDFMFAAFMTIGTTLAVFIVGPFAPPGYNF
jgi:hypothetical protein